MEGEYNVSTDTEETIELPSEIVAADWLTPVARGGTETPFIVRTSNVAEGSAIEIKGISSTGKAPGKIRGTIYNNEFRGRLLIPEKVRENAEIWFEAKLPRHGLKMESGIAIPAKPAITASAIGWDKKEVRRGDSVLMSCRFESGVVDGQDAVFVIYEHNPNTCDFRVTSFSTFIKGNKAESLWWFDYQDDTNQIATKTELDPHGKNYVPPQYYFMVVVDGVKVGENRESGLLVFKDFIEINLGIESGFAVADKTVTVTFADGSIKDEKLDDKGYAKISDTPPGPYTVELKSADSASIVKSSGGGAAGSGGSASGTGSGSAGAAGSNGDTNGGGLQSDTGGSGATTQVKEEENVTENDSENVMENVPEKGSATDKINKIKILCEKYWDTYQRDCSGFAKAVAKELHVSMTGQANDIVDQIQNSPWKVLKDGSEADAEARSGKFVIAGLKATGNGHVAIIVPGTLAHGKYPTGYWGSIAGVGRKNQTINYSWNKTTRDKVNYASVDF